MVIAMRKTYLITGATGFVGSAISKKLLAEGNHLIVLTRRMEYASHYFQGSLSVVSSVCDIPSDQNIDVMINLAGESIAGGRWTKAKKNELVQSRVSITNALVDLCKRLDAPPKVFISASAIGVYGTHSSERFTETTFADDCFTRDLCLQWEQTAQNVEALGCRLCIMRLGIVLGHGGALKQMLPAFKFGLGGPIGSGQQWFSWIHLDDVTGAIEFFIDHEDVSGVFNLVAPEPVINQEFANALGAAINRPSKLRMPSILVKLLFGEMGNELLLNGQYVESGKLQTTGYTFKYASVNKALDAILN